VNRHDRKQWKSAATMADLGELVVAWLHGEIQQTPGHLGPPDPETIPLVPALTAANRATFITNQSQQAGGDSEESCYRCAPWEAFVEGFAADITLERLRSMAASAGLGIGACRRREHCNHRQMGWGRCPWRECVGFWSDCCPAVAGELEAAWYVGIYDPEPGRNDRLWPALRTLTRTS
jgi:hypothetical protein